MGDKNKRFDHFNLTKATTTTDHVVDNIFIFSPKEAIRDITAKGLLAGGEDQGFGNFAANMSRGVPHFYFLGVDRGIEKNISLTDIADSSTKQAVYYSSRSSLVTDGVSSNKIYKKTGIPPAVFQAEIETIGFPLFNIGQLIYIDLINRTREGDPSRMLKASGYYSIIKVNHEITPEDFSSKITAIIQVPFSDRREIAKEVLDPSKKSKKITQLTKQDKKRLQRTVALQKIADEVNAADKEFQEEKQRHKLTSDSVNAELKKAKESDKYKKILEKREEFKKEQEKSIRAWRIKNKTNQKAYKQREKELKSEHPDDSSKVQEELKKFVIEKLKSER